MKISQLITEESHRYHAAYNQKPEMVFLGTKQMDEIDAMVAAMQAFGFLRQSERTIKRPVFDGMEIYRVDAENHLSFGVKQPSPCG